jgi:hypothetical protein
MDGILVGLSFGKIEPACPFLLFPSFIKIIKKKKKKQTSVLSHFSTLHVMGIPNMLFRKAKLIKYFFEYY